MGVNSSCDGGMHTAGSREMVPKRWLITGGCGFIGTSLIKNLGAENCHLIRIVDNLSVGTREDLSRVCDFVEVDPDTIGFSSKAPNTETYRLGQCELVVADILDEELARKVAQDVDVIVHLAANTGVEPSVKDPRSDCMINVIGTLNYLMAARHNNIPRFVFASSGAPIGECEPPIHEELAPHPVSPYGASKLAGEAYCSAYFHSFEIETVALRFGNVYGPGSDHKNSVVAKHIRQSLHGEIMEIYGDGKQTRDFIYIDDLVQAIRLAASVEGIGGETFQIATNAETTVVEVVEMLLPILTAAGINDLRVRHAGPRKGDVRRNFSDTSKVWERLGWRAEVDLSNGLERTVDAFIKRA